MTSIAKRDVTVMETATGKYIDLLNPKPEDICLEDIAVGLSNVCRFGGQVSRFYSVAEHCIRVADAMGGAIVNGQLGFKLAGLFHDAHEAYTNDIIAPLKYALVDDNGYSELKYIQRGLDAAIAEHFDLELSLFSHTLVKQRDDAVMFREAAALKHSAGIGEHWGNTEAHEPYAGCGWEPIQARYRFMETYRRLMNATP